MESISAGMVRGAGWNVLFRVLDRSIGFISTLVLARLLVPADFGVIALASSLIALLALLGEIGLDLALIRHPHAERRHFDTVWTFNVLFGLSMALALALLAPPTARLYGEPRLAPVMFGLAIARAISGFDNVGVIAMRKEMAFDQEFRLSLIRRMATTFLATLPLAFILRDYWALVGGTIAGSCIGLVLSYRMHPFRPRFSLSAMRELFGFSQWLQLANIVGFLSGRAADFLIAKAAGASALGSYALAKEIASLTTAELAMPIHRGVFPGYAKLSGDPAQLKSAYLKVASVLALLILPAGVGLSLVAQPAVYVFLGGKWAEVVPLLQILSVNSVLAVSLSSTAYVYLALGTPRYSAILGALHAGVSLPSMLWLVPAWGATGAACALLAGSLVTLPVNLRLMSRSVALTLRDLAGITWRPFAATLAMAGAVATVRQYWLAPETFGASLVNLVTAAGTGGVVYCAAILLLWHLSARPRGAEAFVMDRVQGALAAAGGRMRAWRAKTP